MRACVAHMLLKTKAQYQIYLECFNSYLVFSHNTALHAASAKGHIEVCKLLVSSLANVHATNRGCDAHPRDMILKTNADFLFFILNCNACLIFSGRNALHHASHHGHVEVCKFLVASKADPDAKMPNRCDARPLVCFQKKCRFSGFVLKFVTIVCFSAPSLHSIWQSRATTPTSWRIYEASSSDRAAAKAALVA